MSLFCTIEDLSLLRLKLSEESKITDSIPEKLIVKLNRDIASMREKVNQLESQLDKQEKRE